MGDPIHRWLRSIWPVWKRLHPRDWKAFFSAPVSTDPLGLGRAGEREAYRFLRRRGFQIVARNYASAHGEIDLIAWDHDILCFVEVKTRAGTEHGRPEEAVTAFKQGQILNTSFDYLRQANLHSIDIRYDIVSVQYGRGGPAVCRLIPQAFGGRRR